MARALACMLAAVMAFSFACTPTALARTGVTANEDADMVYYWGTSGSHSTHSLHLFDSDWAYCVDPYNGYMAGRTYTSEDPVETGKLSQECVTDLALAYRYVWDENLYTMPNGDPLENDVQRYAATQVLVWTILHNYYPDIGPSHNRITVKGVEVTGDGSSDTNNKVALRWVAANRDNYIGHCEYYDAGIYQSFALSFTSEALSGSITLKKASSNPSISKDNALYSLKGASYGIYSDASCRNEVAELVTNKSGEAQADDIPIGTYYVKEKEAPAGFALDTYIYTVEVAAGETVAVGGSKGLADTPQSNVVELLAQKKDAETANGGAQGSATLAGAQFTVCYYDGYYDAGSLPSQAVRTWVVKTDANGLAKVQDDYLVGGDALYRDENGNAVIPLGTVSMTETAAPSGYLMPTDAQTTVVQIKAGQATGVHVSSFEPAAATDLVQRGDVVVGKIDRQNGQGAAQGSATLEDVVFEIVTDNAQPVVVDGTTYSKGQVVCSITTALEDGVPLARTEGRMLPVGTYIVRETSTGEGYLYDEESKAWSQAFEITSDGYVADLTSADVAASNQVIRGDIEFSKVDGQTAERLGRTAFLITSETTGEQHVLVTDENGMASTAASWNAHTALTNANDKAVTSTDDELVVDADALNPNAGIWFNGRTDLECDPDDELGALPFDAYTVSELRCPANEGLELVTFTTVVSRNARELDLGTIDDNPGPSIGTSLADGNGAKLVPADAEVTLVDTVSYVNLDPGESYTLLGELHAVDDEGEDAGVVATGELEFEPTSSSGSAEVAFTFDSSEAATRTLVATERLLDANGSELCTHEDLSDPGQTVTIPEIQTELTDSDGHGDVVAAVGTVQLVDTVAYSGLTPGRTYILQATLHERDEDGNDAGVAVDENGQPIQAKQSFTPSEEQGQAEVTFTFAAPALAGKTVVAFEELLFRDVSYATHADISDEAQTVRFPSVGTTLQSGTGQKTVEAGENVRLVDTVSYTNLVPGERYTLVGTLHVVADGSDRGELRDSSGVPALAKTMFTPEEADGQTTVEFSIDATGLGGKSLVAFEVLLDGDDTVLASHEDITDEGQTVLVEKPPVEEKKKKTVKKTTAKTTTPTTTVKKVTTRPASEARTLAKTGDSIPSAVLVLIPSALIGLGLAAFAVSRMKRREPIHVQRGPQR